MQKVIALSSDYNYISQIETTIKSILFNNLNVKIYVINSDIPQEWFLGLNKFLANSNSEIHDIKINPNNIQHLQTSWDHISNITWGRILIPELINDDQVLYLDSDIIVNGNLNDLFRINMQQYMLGAVPEYFKLAGNTKFNAGVLLLNNRVLKKDTNFVPTLFKQAIKKLDNGDQTALNNYFPQYYHLNDTYNFQIGFDALYQSSMFKDQQTQELYENQLRRTPFPKIIHYMFNSKPWYHNSYVRLKDKWWYYRMMDFSTAVNHVPKTDRPCLFTMTNTQDFKNLEELVKLLPNYTFQIAAWTEMGWKLSRLQQYPNVRLYPGVIPPVRKALINNADCYLDINFNPKDINLVKNFADSGRPIFTFNSTTSNITNQNYYTFNDEEVNKMANKIRSLVQ